MLVLVLAMVLLLVLVPVLVQVLVLTMLLMLMTGEGGSLEGLPLLRARGGSVTDTAGGNGSCSAWQTRHRQLVSVALAGLLTTGRRNLACSARICRGQIRLLEIQVQEFVHQRRCTPLPMGWCAARLNAYRQTIFPSICCAVKLLQVLQQLTGQPLQLVHVHFCSSVPWALHQRRLPCLPRERAMCMADGLLERLRFWVALPLLLHHRRQDSGAAKHGALRCTAARPAAAAAGTWVHAQGFRLCRSNT